MDKIKFLDSAGLEIFAEGIKNKIESATASAVFSVNNIAADSSHNVTISSVPSADYADTAGLAKQAIDLESNSIVEQTNIFSLRTTGGNDDVFSGIGRLKKIYGNSHSVDVISSSLTAFLSTDTETSIDNWQLSTTPETFSQALGDNNYSGSYSFIYNNGTWSLNGPDNFSQSNISLSTYGINLVPPTGAPWPSSMIISCEYSISYSSLHEPGIIENFSSTGFNLYNNSSGIGYAKVVGNERYIIQYPDGENPNNYNVKFSTNASDWNETITCTDDEEGLIKISNVFTPSENGYIAIFSKENDSKVIINNLMINLIWSGKKLDNNGQSTFEAYKKYTKSFKVKDATNYGVVLDRVRNVYDEIDFLNIRQVENKNYYVKTQRIFNFSYSGADLESHFKNIIYFKSGNDIYYDCNSLKSHPEALKYTQIEGGQKQFRFNTEMEWITYHDEEEEILIDVVDSGINIAQQDLKNDNSFLMDDFGLEETNSYYEYNGKKPLEMEFNIVYNANLIDKLRRSVITYSLQPNVSNEERATGRQNLQLIIVKCFIGKHITKVKADLINNDGEILAYGPEIQSSDNSQYVEFQLSSLGIWKFSTTINGKEVSTIQNINYYGNYDIKLVGKRYGFKREKRNQNPSSRITYLFDAEGFAPISFSDTNNCLLGDWEEFINEVACPVYIGKDNGENVIKLGRNNQTVDEFGNSYISTDNGDYMVGFYKYKYVARKQDSLYEYVVFSDEDLSDDEWDYQCYAHAAVAETDENNNIVLKPGNAFYWGMFGGSYLNTAEAGAAYDIHKIDLKSIPAAATFASSYNFAQIESIARHRNNYTLGSTDIKRRWNIGYKSAWDYICDLITLVAKTDNIQADIGAGIGHKAAADTSGADFSSDTWSGAGFIRDPNYDQTPAGTTHIRLFWIWDFFGVIRQPILGFFRRNISTQGINNTYYYVKMTDADKNYLALSTEDSSQFGLQFDPTSPSADLGSDSSFIDYYGYVKIENNKLNTQVNGNYISEESINKYGIIPTKATITASGSGISDVLIANGVNSRTTYYATIGFGQNNTNSNGEILLKNGPRALDFQYQMKSNANVPVPTAQVVSVLRPRLTCIEPEELA